ncbi:MAG: hypothetical protein WD512_14000 [Candidatus Paceibacterota bacterium]
MSFQLLKGKELSMKLLRDKEYRKEYKEYQKSVISHFNNIMNERTTYELRSNDSNHKIFYIVSPSMYDSNKIQLTTFVNETTAYSHMTYNSIKELLEDNKNLFVLAQYKIYKELVA